MNECNPVQGSLELLARQLVAGSLAQAFLDPRCREGSAPSPDTETLERAWRFLVEAAPSPTSDELGLGERPPSPEDAGPLLVWLGTDASTRTAVYQEIFGLLVSKECPPYETEYCHWHDPTYRANQLADVAGFYRAFGVEPSGEHPERPDHVALELELVTLLLEKLRLAREQADEDGEAVCSDALAAFVRDHVAWWMPTFARSVERRAEALLAGERDADQREGLEALRGVALLLRSWVTFERRGAGLPPSREVASPRVETVSPEACDGCPLSA